MNVFWFELRRLVRPQIGWFFGIAALIAIYISVYPSFSEDAEATKKIFQSLPPAVHAAINFDVDVMFSFLGFLANVFTIFLLFAGIHGAILGLGLLSREPRNHTTDFLFTKPLSRRKIFFAKLGAGLFVAVLMSVWVVLIELLMTQVVNTGDFDGKTFLLISASFAFVELWFFAVGMVVSQMVRRLKNTVPIGLGLGFGMFLVGTIGSLIDAEKTRWFAPAKYFDFIYILKHGEYELKYLAVGVAVIAVSLIISFLIYTRRDVESSV